MRVSIIEMIVFTAIVGAIAASWRSGQDRGMAVAIILISMMVYYANRIRSKPPLLSNTLMALPILAIVIFGIALLTGLRHPPLMVPTEWQWPPFATIQERIVHAFALASWTFIFGTPTVLVLGFVHRLIEAICE